MSNNSKANIAFYGSHNAAFAVEKDGKVVTVIEVERFTNQKNAGYSQYLTSYSRPYLVKYVLDYIKKEYGIDEYETCYFLNTDCIEDEVKYFHHKMIPADNYVGTLHHGSHAACGFYQSDYQEALIVSYDGGGNDGFFNVYVAPNRKEINLIEKFNVDLGFPYMSFGDYLGDIKYEHALSIGNLVYSGKIMGLCSYGKVREEWLPFFEKYYERKPDGINFRQYIKELGDEIGIQFSVKDRLLGDVAYDVAKTSQQAFENVFMRMMNPFFEQYPNLPLVVVGGCGLNILLNTRLHKELGRGVFVPPNPNDCGIAAGMILNHIKPEKGIDLTYAGIPILDRDILMSYVEERRPKVSEIQDLVNDLKGGKIIGVVRDTSEHGPRALGNRSIICNPTYPDMKDTLNAKVKDREWYRPFAPVVRLEDVSKYFDFEGESRWMGFCPTVKEEWREKLISITHVDNTARVQTVTKEQNPWLYDLITEFEKETGVGVLLNTSFNVNGKPILSRYQDAMKVYESTKMDCLLLQDFYFRK